MEVLVERQPFLLFDRMVAFHIQRGLAVPLSAPEFYQGLRQHFRESDGMVFTPLQRAEYDKRRMQAEDVAQLALFASDERSAIQWLHRELATEDGAGPQTYQELSPSSYANCIRRGTKNYLNCATCWKRTFSRTKTPAGMCLIQNARKIWTSYA
jgi:hypothetical protein